MNEFAAGLGIYIRSMQHIRDSVFVVFYSIEHYRFSVRYMLTCF